MVVAKIFQNKIFNWLLGILLFIYASSLSYNVFQSLQRTPFEIKSVEIVNTTIKVGEPLQLTADIYLYEQHCSASATRIVVDQETGKTFWSEITPLNRDVRPTQGPQIVTIKMSLPPGSYYYQATVHMTCGTTNLIVSTKLLSFTVVAA